MKKQAAYFIIWDVLFILVLYLNSSADLWVKEYVARTMDITSRIWMLYAWPVVTGCFIAVLVCIGSSGQITGKSALLELILIGIPMLYIAALPFQYLYIIPAIAMNFRIQFPFPFWFMQESIVRTGGIILGYEIFIFTARMIRLRPLKPSKNFPDLPEIPEREVSER